MVNKKKPELLVTAKNMAEFQELVNARVDAILIGGKDYGLRLKDNFTLENIKEAVEFAHKKDVKVYLLMDALFANDMISNLERYLKKLALINIDAIVLQDPAVLVLAKRYLPNVKLHISTDTTITNVLTIKYWADKGFNRAVLAKELSLDEVGYIKQNSGIEIEVQIHGLTSIFYSKRKLITNYLKYVDENKLYENIKEKDLFLREHMRPDEKYPVIEDKHGTHVMSSHDTCMIEHLDKLIDLEIDSFKIEGFLYSTEDLVMITNRYRQAIDKIMLGKSESIGVCDGNNR